MSLVTEALQYAERGFSIIPVGKDKRPLIKWSIFQTRIATSNEIQQWFVSFPEANIAVVTGAISGIVVVDIEAGGDTTWLIPTVMARTQGGGIHAYYKHPGRKVIAVARIRPLTDIRGDGGYALLPPSKGEKGHYEWLVSPDTADFADLSPEILGQVLDDERPPADWDKLAQGAQAGERNQSLTQVIGKIISGTPVPMWQSIVWPVVLEWNKRSIPPLGLKELRAVWDSITGREIKGRPEERKQTIDSDSQGEIWDNFSVSGGSRYGDLVFLDTSVGKLQIKMEDLYSQFIFKRKVFSSFCIVLGTKKPKVWSLWLEELGKKLTLGDEQETFSPLRTAVEDTLDELIEDCLQSDVSFLSKGQPIFYGEDESVLAFRFNDFLNKLSKQKAIIIDRSQVRILFDQLGIKKIKTSKNGKDVRCYLYTIPK